MSKSNQINIFKIDQAHSNIGFKVKHMMWAKVNGRFDEYKANLEMPENDFEKAKLHFTAKTASINTHDQERDEHLRSSDFFNANLYKQIKFKSSNIKKIKENKFIVQGFLKMNNIEQAIELTTETSGLIKDPKGFSRIILNMTGKINRLKWGMKWNKPLESGGILVSKEVNLIIETEFILQ